MEKYCLVSKSVCCLFGMHWTDLSFWVWYVYCNHKMMWIERMEFKTFMASHSIFSIRLKWKNLSWDWEGLWATMWNESHVFCLKIFSVIHSIGKHARWSKKNNKIKSMCLKMTLLGDSFGWHFFNDCFSYACTNIQTASHRSKWFAMPFSIFAQ